MKRIISVFIGITTLLLISHNIYACKYNSQIETNKHIVMDFYNKLINQKDFPAAARYIAPHFKQHNPLVGDGVEGLSEFVLFLQKNYPNAHSEIKKIFAEGDYVFIHVLSIREPNTRGRAIFDLFKLENGKIVEHWDTIQEIPEQAANANSMF